MDIPANFVAITKDFNNNNNNLKLCRHTIYVMRT